MNIILRKNIKKEYKRIVLKVIEELTQISYKSIYIIKSVFRDIKIFLNLGGFIL